MCATCHPLYSFQYLLRQATPTFTLPHTAWRPRSLLASSSTNLLGVPVYHRPHPHEAQLFPSTISSGAGWGVIMGK